jgi:GMP synthase (glutamine-hydrolysing)
MAKIIVLQNHLAEPLGAIADSLATAALAWQYVRVYEGQPVPHAMRGAGGLVVMGGPQTVYQLDRYPYLRDEIRLIEDALRENKPILGVCLGSQLLAAALGARVYRNTTREIGWYRVTLRPAAADDRLLRGLSSEFVAVHWHSDIFDLPAGAVPLAASEKTPIQGFRQGDRAYGLLFHAEMTSDILESLVAEFGGGLQRVGVDGRAILAAAPQYLPKLQAIGDTIFTRWAAPIQGT